MKSRILMRYLRLPRNTNVAKNEMQLFLYNSGDK
jgi:hypothetical protein